MDDCIEFECNPKMVAVARAFVADRLGAWEVTAGVDEAVLVASELVGNAVLHARTCVQLRVIFDGTIRLEVRDENSRIPTPAACPLDATSGRGLAMVAALTSAWGIDNHDYGKVVWAEINGSDDQPDQQCIDLRDVDVSQVLREMHQARSVEQA